MAFPYKPRKREPAQPPAAPPLNGAQVDAPDQPERATRPAQPSGPAHSTSRTHSLPAGADPIETFRADPRVRQARAAMQAGDFAKALVLLEGMAKHYEGVPIASDEIEGLLAECTFKADFERTAAPRVRPRRSGINWRRLAGTAVMVTGVLAVVLLGVTVVRARVMPMMTETDSLAHQATLLSAGRNALAAGNLDLAEETFVRLLALNPQVEEATDGLAAITLERERAAAYAGAEKLYAAGDYAGAAAAFGELQRSAPNYRDINSRVLQIRRTLQLEELYAQAQVQMQLGFGGLALTTLNEIQSVSTDFRRQEVQETLFHLNVEQGRALINQTPIDFGRLPVALELFTAALRQRPSDTDVQVQQQLLVNFLGGRDAHGAGQWAEAVRRLEAVYLRQPAYLAGAVPPLLYQAYLGYGDLLRAAGDLYRAYELYRLAAELPVADTVLARGRLAELEPFLTPTPTPAPTLPPASPVPSATPTPTPTPRPLLSMQGRIVFRSDNPDATGYWVMDATGGNREYLGSVELYEEILAAYRETERIAPGGDYRVQVGSVDKRAQVLLGMVHDSNFAPRPITRLSEIAYDPVWAPDGSLIAFVTQENESDDIWVISSDSSIQEALMRNPWEWDKHPTWSPDSTRIAFMSNRDGTLGIWVMERNGRNPRNISNTSWAEYDPIWIK